LALLWYKLHGRQKSRRKGLYVAVLQQDKNKSPAHSADARQKKSPAIADRVKRLLFGCFEQRREKPKNEQYAGKYHLYAPPYTTLKRL
jgi:hypothetical protein